MKRFQREDRFDNDRGDRGDRKSFMYPAVCNDCGKKCEVPFKPTGDRPIYCSDCFENHRDSNSKRSSSRRSDKSSFGDRPKFSTVCDKCGKRCEVPFRPTQGKPIYCDNCFDRGSSDNKSRGSGPSSDQLSVINKKLDQILEIISPKLVTPKAKKKVAEAVKGKKNKEDKKIKESKVKKEKAATVKKTATKKKVAKKKK